MAKVEKKEFVFFPTDIDYAVLKDGSTEVRIFGITKQHKRVVVLDKNFYPYFWITLEKDTAKKKSDIEAFATRLKSLKVKHGDKYISPVDVKKESVVERCKLLGMMMFMLF